MITCGAILIAGSFAENRAGLWDLGIPIAMAGQILFLIGLVFHLDLICQHGRRASESLLSLSIQTKTSAQEGPAEQTSTAAPDVLAELKERLENVATRLTRHSDS